MSPNTEAFRSSKIGFYKPEGASIETLDPKDFHVLDTEEKKHIFRENVSRYTKARQRGSAILKRLQTLSLSVRCRFELKPDPIDKLTMRLWCPGTERPNDYVCLSYCWNQVNTSAPSSTSVPLPISPLMFSAFAAQRGNDTTGLWVDQFCIDQKNVAEKTVSVSAMDAVYRCAERVVVVLHDVQVHLAQQRFLRTRIQDEGSDWWYDVDGKFRHHSVSPPFMQTNPVFRRLLYEILQSKYFQRAWCSHELQMRGKYVFLVPCQPLREEDSCTEIFHFTSDFLLYMIFLSSKVPSYTSAKQVDRYHGVVERLSALKFNTAVNRSRFGIPIDYGTRSPRHMSSYPARIREIFSLEAGGDPDLPADLRASSALLDKSTIVLNIVNNGLGIRRRWNRRVTEDECIADLYMIGLAAHDPTTISSMGPHMIGGSEPDRLSWLRRPAYMDLGCGELRDFPIPHMIPPLSHNIRVDPSPERKWIELDVFAMTNLRTVQKRYQDLAANLLTKCLSLDMGRAPDPLSERFGMDPLAEYAGKTDLASRIILSTLATRNPWGVGPDYRYWYHQTFIGTMRRRFEDTIACILECGPKWVIGSANRCGFPNPRETSLKLLSLVLDDGTWDLNTLNSMTWTTHEAGKDAVNAIFSFANWMVSWGSDSVYGSHSDAVPALIDHGRAGTAMVYVFGTSMCQLVVPAALLEDHYSRLYRVWHLAARDDPHFEKISRGMGAEWYLRAKALLFTDVADGETVALTEPSATGRPGWRYRHEVRVHGPPLSVNDEIVRVLGNPKP